MTSGRTGRADLAVAASLMAVVAAMVALVTSGLLAWQLREDGRRARLSANVESVWHLSDQWNSGAMLDVRSAAATALLAGKPTADVDAVLEFFETLALLLRREAVDEELAALQFSWPLANYWAASRDYVRPRQGDQPSVWEDVGALMTRLTAVVAQRRRHGVADLQPSAEQMRQFLLDEQGTDECDDDTQPEKTPL